jgi:hypothetical protein
MGWLRRLTRLLLPRELLLSAFGTTRSALERVLSE